MKFTQRRKQYWRRPQSAELGDRTRRGESAARTALIRRDPRAWDCVESSHGRGSKRAVLSVRETEIDLGSERSDVRFVYLYDCGVGKKRYTVWRCVMVCQIPRMVPAYCAESLPLALRACGLCAVCGLWSVCSDRSTMRKFGRLISETRGSVERYRCRRDSLCVRCARRPPRSLGIAARACASTAYDRRSTLTQSIRPLESLDDPHPCIEGDVAVKLGFVEEN